MKCCAQRINIVNILLYTFLGLLFAFPVLYSFPLILDNRLKFYFKNLFIHSRHLVAFFVLFLFLSVNLKDNFGVVHSIST